MYKKRVNDNIICSKKESCLDRHFLTFKVCLILMLSLQELLEY